MAETQGSIEHTYRRYFALIRAKCTRVLGDTSEAEDVAQETFTRLWRHRHAIESEPRQIIAWIYRTATHLAIDQLRRRRAAPREFVEARHLESAEAKLGARHDLGQLAQQLEPKELELAVLHRVDGLGQREIAEVLGVSERTVRRWLERLEQRLISISEGAP
jgi:RNA polymerase sigma-70 factor, ECF subfamily